MLHTAEGTLTATPPFDFAQSLRYLGGFEPMGGEQILADGTLTKGLRVGDRPAAYRLADADPDALLDAVGQERRARYLRAVAAAFAAANDDWLRAAPWDEVHARLRAIDGIGPWSAAFIMLRGIGRMERLPIGKARLAEIVARRYNGGRSVSEAEIADFAAPYGDYRGYWAHYLRAAG